MIVVGQQEFHLLVEDGVSCSPFYVRALLLACNQKLDKAFAWYQDLVTQERLNEMMPGKATSEGYALRQVAEATRKAEIQAKWFYNQGITEEMVL